MKSLIKLIFGIFKRKKTKIAEFDVNMKSQNKLKDVFGVDKDTKFATFHKEDVKEVMDRKERLKKLLETIEKDPDRL